MKTIIATIVLLTALLAAPAHAAAPKLTPETVQGMKAVAQCGANYGVYVAYHALPDGSAVAAYGAYEMREDGPKLSDPVAISHVDKDGETTKVYLNGVETTVEELMAKYPDPCDLIKPVKQEITELDFIKGDHIGSADPLGIGDDIGYEQTGVSRSADPIGIVGFKTGAILA